jgi:hypothetical protein
LGHIKIEDRAGQSKRNRQPNPSDQGIFSVSFHAASHASVSCLREAVVDILLFSIPIGRAKRRHFSTPLLVKHTVGQVEEGEKTTKPTKTSIGLFGKVERLCPDLSGRWGK